ncbi:MAG: glycosyltransferase, partial [bacterium]
DQVTGLVVPIADSAALAQGVLKLLADETLARRLGQRGHELMAARFSLNVMVDGIANVYREVA